MDGDCPAISSRPGRPSKAMYVGPVLLFVAAVAYGVLEVHSPDQAETRAAGEAILDAINLTEDDRIKPRLLSSQIIRRIETQLQ